MLSSYERIASASVCHARRVGLDSLMNLNFNLEIYKGPYCPMRYLSYADTRCVPNKIIV